MKRFFPRLVLGLSGAVLLVVGGAVLLNPVGFAAANGVSLPDSASMLSEYRAPGGLLVASGVLMILGSAVRRLMPAGLLAGGVVYCSYGASRLLGYLLDGAPSVALTQAMVVELFMGGACLLTLFVLRHADRQPSRTADLGGALR